MLVENAKRHNEVGILQLKKISCASTAKSSIDPILVFDAILTGKFGWLDAVRGKKIQTNVWKIGKINSTERLLAKLFPSNLVNTIPDNLNITIQKFCKIQFWKKSYSPSDSHTNTVISDH